MLPMPLTPVRPASITSKPTGMIFAAFQCATDWPAAGDGLCRRIRRIDVAALVQVAHPGCCRGPARRRSGIVLSRA